ncbi:hypothetical protein F0562_028436 [Nyssa sinensis]|uniref:ACT domain-containing protein n=1 Tax=Nyssa sinensis TaxID=561372 RepID=A0A5J5B098_9ASTE|nr:hypothetical protein F0562_028436 [Nyssa sinensis]
MAAGQFLDLEGGPNSVEFVLEKKFGELGECSAVCGGLLAGAGDDEIQRLRRYGRAVGVLYQVVDDVLEAKMKTEDQEEKKKKGKSYVRVYGVEKAMEIAEGLRAKAKRELDGFEKYGERVVPLYSFVDYAADRGFSVGVQDYNINLIKEQIFSSFPVIQPMVMEDNENCSSRVVESSPANTRQQRQKLEVYSEVLRRLKESDNQEAKEPGFDDELWAHFNRLPTRYALDVNVERAEDVLTHKRLLHLAHDPANRPAFEVRLVQVPPISDGNTADAVYSGSPRNEVAQSIHPPPAFGSSPNLEALALEENKSQVQDGDSAVNAHAQFSWPMHEITFSTDDKPKLLSQLTTLLAEVGLNIQEAHAFSTVDGYSLDVFVVDGWPYEETKQLRNALEKEFFKIEKQSWPNLRSLSPSGEQEKTGIKFEPDHFYDT